MTRFAIIFALFFISICGHSQRSANYGSIPHILKSNLKTSKLLEINQDITNSDFGIINSLIISQNNRTVFENHYNGYCKDSTHKINSINKSITSLLFGILLEKHPEISVDDSIYHYFPQYIQIFESEPAKKTITIRHILEMTTGFEWNEWIPHYIYNDNSLNKYRNSDKSWIENTLRLKLSKTPGKVFNYNSGVSQLIAHIIEFKSGQNLHDFAMENFFLPIGIKKVNWTLDKHNGYPAWGGLRLNAAQMLKIGQLIQNQGKLHNQQIVPANWISDATSSHIASDKDYYGYQFWTRTEPFQMIYAAGYGDNFIFVLPQQDIVIVIAASNYLNHKFPRTMFELVNDIVKTIQ